MDTGRRGQGFEALTGVALDGVVVQLCYILLIDIMQRPIAINRIGRKLFCIFNC